MENREKKPPIEINKKVSSEEKPKQGRLSYIAEEEEKGRRSTTRMQGIIGLPQILTSVIVSLIVAALMVFQLAPGEGEFQSLSDKVSGQGSVLAGVDSKAGTETERLDTVIAAMGEYAKKSELGGYATKGSVDALAGLPTDLDSRFSTLQAEYNAKVSSYEDRVGELEDRLTELEEVKVEEEEAIEEGEGDITVSPGWSSTFVFLEGDTFKEARLSLEVMNHSNWDVKDIELQVTVHTRGTPIVLSSVSISDGWPLVWERIYLANGIVVLRGFTPQWSDGLQIDEGDDVVLYLTLGLTTKEGEAPTSDVTFWVEGKVTKSESM